MELYTKIRQFVDLQKILNAETWEIFRPILDEVERQDKKYLLFPPVADPLSIEWVVMHDPKGGIPMCYQHLFLEIRAAQESEGLELVIVERYVGLPNELFLEVFKKNPRTIREITIDDIKAFCPELNSDKSKESEEVKETTEVEDYGEEGIFELERFPVNGGINPAAVAKRILTEARRIYREQTVIRSRKRKNRSKRRARVLQDKP